MDALSMLKMVRMDPAGMPGLNPQLGAVSKGIPARELEPLRPANLPPPGTPAVGGPSFADTLHRLVDEVGQKQQVSAAAVNNVLAGEGLPLHQAVIAMEEAGVSFQLMVEVRNRLLESYHELMRMQV